MLPIHDLDVELQRTKMDLEEAKTRLRKTERLLNKLYKFCVLYKYPDLAEEIENVLWSIDD